MEIRIEKRRKLRWLKFLRQRLEEKEKLPRIKTEEIYMGSTEILAEYQTVHVELCEVKERIVSEETVVRSCKLNDS